MNPDNIILKKHLLDGGLGVFLKDNYICFGDGEKTETIINVNDMPATLEGKLTYNIENAMAAASACIGLKLDAETITKGLKTFYLDGVQNPGRFNVYNMDNFKVVVDYGHNIAGYQAVLKSLKGFDAKRLVGVIGVPGDRTDESIIKIGSICAQGFDEIYIKEDVDRRGRSEGEVARLLETGVQSVQNFASNYKIILNEGAALKEAMENAESGDVISVFYEDYNTIMQAIESFKNNKPLANDIAEAL
jgi:cyanophycin synthetase